MGLDLGLGIFGKSISNGAFGIDFVETKRFTSIEDSLKSMHVINVQGFAQLWNHDLVFLLLPNHV